MNGQYIAVKTGNGLQNSGKKSRLVVHLNDKGDRLPSGLFMKGKNIILIFIKRAAADARLLRGVLHRLHSAGIQQFLGLHYFQKNLRHRALPDYEVFLFFRFFSHFDHPVPEIRLSHTSSEQRGRILFNGKIPRRRCPFSKDTCFPTRDMLPYLQRCFKSFFVRPVSSTGRSISDMR